MKRKLLTIISLVCAAGLFAFPVSADDTDSNQSVVSETSGDVWTDPETGYTYEDGVNVTIQGDIMLLSLDEDDLAATDSSEESEIDSESEADSENSADETASDDVMLISEQSDVPVITEVPKTGVKELNFLSVLTASGFVIFAAINRLGHKNS